MVLTELLPSFAEEDLLPVGFVRLSKVVPTIRQDIRYIGSDNFLGRPVRGYKAAECIVTNPTAEALAKVQAEVQLKGYTLKVYDCYRPQQAVDDFVEWAKNSQDQRMKTWFYPNVSKDKLFAQGYIAEHSGHSRGSTVDLTLTSLQQKGKKQRSIAKDPMEDCRDPAWFRFRDDSLDMGTAFDCFDLAAHTNSRLVSRRAQANRHLLQRAMERQGFKNLPEEWWHYTLIREPFPDYYFNFPVQ